MATHKIKIELSPDGQEAAARAGQDAAMEQWYIVGPELVGALLDAGGAVDYAGNVELIARWARSDNEYDLNQGALQRLDVRPTDAEAAIAAVVAAKTAATARVAAERAARRQKVLARCEARVDGTGIAFYFAPGRGWDEEATALLTPEERSAFEARYAADVAAKREAADQLIRDALARDEAAWSLAHNDARDASPELREAAKQQEAARRERAEATRVAAKQKSLRHLASKLVELDLADERLRAHATDETPLGLWSEPEARRAIRDRILPLLIGAPGSSVSARRSWTQSSVPYGEDCEDRDDCKAAFVAPQAETLDAAEYAAARKVITMLRAKLTLVPEGNDLRTDAVWQCVYRHAGTRPCLPVEDSLSELEVTVTVDLGDGLEIEREYLIV